MKTLSKSFAIILLSIFSVVAFANKVDLNKADKQELVDGLKGLTEKQAEAIIEYREEEGRIASPHELTFVGIDKDVLLPNYNRMTW
jgi:competence ComEA-like helix-hairpin-helix protein